MHLSAGARVRSFEVVGPLGAGGMGAVYRARDGKLGREVAIKFLQDELAQSREYLHRFEREARAASALNHPNIVTIYEIGELDGDPFIAMELIDGVSLRGMLKKGPLPVRKLLDVAAQTADGLAAAHERGIVHRDLKPENVMVTSDGRVKILDFGLARVNRTSAPTDSTSEFSAVRTPDGRIIGTASYVSPEQATGGRNIDYRSDQFSFGALLYELATAHRAFERNSTVETLAAIVRDEPEPVQRRNPKLPPQLVWIIERCLSKDPADRYASTRDLARELRTLRDRLPETSPGRMPLPQRWSLRARAGIVALIVLAAAIALVTSARHVRSRSEQLPDQKYLAVLPFNDLSGRPDAQLFSQGFADAVSSRLAKYRGIQVIPPAQAAPLIAKKATFKRIAQELGATLLINASVQHAGQTLRVSYSVVNPDRGATISGDDINGSVENLWAIQDDVADSIARDLGIVQRAPSTIKVGLDAPEEQVLYVKVLGALDRADDSKSIDTAIDLLHELTETASESPLVQAALARAYRVRYAHTNNKEDADRAMRAAARARVLNSESADVLMTLGEIQTTTGKYDEAIATFRRAVALQPDSAEALVGLAAALKRKHDVTGAELALKSAIAARGTWWNSHNELGLLYMEDHRFDEAEQEFRSVIALNPENSWGYLNLGALNISRGTLKAAVPLLERAATLGAVGAYTNLGYCYYALGDYDRAAMYDQKAISAAPAASVAVRWANLADACQWSTTCRDRVETSYQKAIELLRRDLQVNPKNARTLGTLAVCLAKTHHSSEAKEKIAQALTLDPTNALRMFQAARVANAASSREEAATWLQRAIKAGYNQAEIEHDPEFADLRATAVYRGRTSSPHVPG